MKKAALLLCALAVAGLATDVVVDRQNKRAEVLVSVPNGRVRVTLDPVTSLLIHCTTLYGLNRQSGVRYYNLRDDEAAKAAVDLEILRLIAGKDRYFSGKGGLPLYEPAMQAAISTGAYRRYPDATALAGIAPEPLNHAMAFTWDRFYRAYWDREFERLLAEFRALNEDVGWAEALAKMESYTGRKWKGDLYVVAGEGAGKSAFFAGSNIVVGAVGPQNDAGFVHEGLHLLLREEWAKDPRIQKLMASKPEGAPPYTRWEAFYEQAVVASLDILIRHLDRLGPADKVADSYMTGLRLGPISAIVWPLVKAHTESPAEPFEDLMLKIATQCEREGKRK